MAENVLYFPYIRVPDNDWFQRVLLYWDSVGSIVPYEYINNPDRLGSHMQSLLIEGLVKQIIPGQYTYKLIRFCFSVLDDLPRIRLGIVASLHEKMIVPTLGRSREPENCREMGPPATSLLRRT